MLIDFKTVEKVFVYNVLADLVPIIKKKDDRYAYKLLRRMLDKFYPSSEGMVNIKVKDLRDVTKVVANAVKIIKVKILTYDKVDDQNIEYAKQLLDLLNVGEGFIAKAAVLTKMDLKVENFEDMGK